jgi:hypothetical protein
MTTTKSDLTATKDGHIVTSDDVYFVLYVGQRLQADHRRGRAEIGSLLVSLSDAVHAMWREDDGHSLPGSSDIALKVCSTCGHFAVELFVEEQVKPSTECYRCQIKAAR